MSNNGLSVGYLGQRGSYSEAAAVEYFGDAVTFVSYKEFDNIFEAVANGEVDRGILPLENSLAGSIHHNYDLLLRYDLAIVGETQIHVAHQLVALPGVTLADVQKVYSHPQPLAQCERTLSQLLPHAELISTYDTASSVKILKDQQLTNSAAISSVRAAQIYGMNILRTDMHDDPENYTRFVVIAREPVLPVGEAKTSIVFSMDNVPGSLYKSLAVFALRDIDLAKIESRPWQGKRWQYLFYIDFIGSIAEERCQNALKHLQEFTTFFKLLGSYPRGV